MSSPEPLVSQIILTAEQCEAIGCVAVESARLEELFDWLLWDLLRVDRQVGGALTGRQQFATKLSVLSDLLKIADEAAWRDIKPLIPDIEEALKRRSVVIHGHWELRNEGQELRSSLRALVSRENLKAIASHRRHPDVKADEVMAIARRFSDLRERTLEFARAHKDVWQ